MNHSTSNHKHKTSIQVNQSIKKNPKQATNFYTLKLNNQDSAMKRKANWPATLLTEPLFKASNNHHGRLRVHATNLVPGIVSLGITQIQLATFNLTPWWLLLLYQPLPLLWRLLWGRGGAWIHVHSTTHSWPMRKEAQRGGRRLVGFQWTQNSEKGKKGRQRCQLWSVYSQRGQ